MIASSDNDARFRVPKPLAYEIAEIAKEEGRSANSQLLQIIKEWLAKRQEVK